MRSGLILLLFSTIAAAADFSVAPTPQTICWGYYWAKAKPVVSIHSGDRVTIQTVSGNPESLIGAGLKPEDLPGALREIVEQVTDKGPGGHILTGPVYIEEAEPGDVLEVRIERITLDSPYAYNGFGPTTGTLQEEYPYRRMKIIPLDRERMIANFGPGIAIPLKPFFGSMGIAPPGLAKLDSAPPWIHAGNMDNRELSAGSTLYIPVHTKGALFEVGDGHAGQGNGEVDITAMETNLTGTFTFIVHKGSTPGGPPRWPWAETPTHYITMGFNEDLQKATDLAIRQMIEFLVSQKHLNRDDAYMLTSVAADVNITQLVDGKKGVHVMCPKAIFTESGRDPMIR